MILSAFVLNLILTTKATSGISTQPTEYGYIQNNTLIGNPSQLPQIKVVSLATLYKEPGNLHKKSVLPKEIDLSCLINCESGGDPAKINPNDMGTPSYGLLQYKLPTWKRYCEGEIMNGQDQIRCAEKMISNGGLGHWRNCAIKCGGIDN